MSFTAPARRTTLRTRRLIAGLVIAIVLATVSGAFALHSAAAREHEDAADAPRADDIRPAAPGDGAAYEAAGELPSGATVFDDRYPGIANIDPDLLSAMRAAADESARHGIVFEVVSGWRSPEHQSRLLREAIATYGPEEAGRWVATPETSAHVSGDAIDLGPSDALSWLSQHGAAYGLCQIYANEPWHYELRPDAADRGCPAVYSDPTQDPRMRR